MFTKFLTGICLLLGVVASASALEMYGFTTANYLSGPGDFAQSTLVQTNNNIWIEQIGIWDLNGDGLAENHGFRIIDVTNNVDLFNGIITAGTGVLLNGFRYIDIADIFVNAGVQIAVLSDNRMDDNNTDLMGYNITGLVFDPAFTHIASTYSYNGTDVNTFPFPQNFSIAPVIVGANLLVSVVPEPASLALLGLGLAGLGFSRRKKG